jgi:solute carrier family 35 (UDP-galactose transporter), member B1
MYVSFDDGAVGSDALQWKFPFALNFFSALVTCTTAYFMEKLSMPVHESSSKVVSPLLFWRPALSATLASPLGYESLKYINYPLMVLTKSSKPVPVMLMGIFFFKQKYQWYKYVSVALLCIGIAIFTFANSSPSSNSKATDFTNDKSSESEIGILSGVFGVLLIIVNLAMDGYTGNEQDRVFVTHKVTAIQMMQFSSLWQCVFQFGLLVAGFLLQGSNSQFIRALEMLHQCPGLKWDILVFCVCSALGQIMIFQLIKEYGSLMWVTITVTRQLFTIILSVVLFGHSVNVVQWFAVLLVFVGLSTEIVLSHKDNAQLSASISDALFGTKELSLVRPGAAARLYNDYGAGGAGGTGGSRGSGLGVDGGVGGVWKALSGAASRGAAGAAAGGGGGGGGRFRGEFFTKKNDLEAFGFDTAADDDDIEMHFGAAGDSEGADGDVDGFPAGAGSGNNRSDNSSGTGASTSSWAGLSSGVYRPADMSLSRAGVLRAAAITSGTSGAPEPLSLPHPGMMNSSGGGSGGGKGAAAVLDRKQQQRVTTPVSTSDKKKAE